MQRIIPKNSKVKMALFKGLSLSDMILICVAMIFAILILMSNFASKIILLVVFVVFVAGLLIGSDEDKMYKQLYYFCHYAVSRKHYEKGAKHGNASDLIPFKEIRADGVIVYDGYFGAVVEVGSVSFGLLDEQEQDRRISEFALVLNSLSQSSVIQLVKIDRPINYDDVARRLFEKLERVLEGNRDPVQEAVLRARLEQVDKMNNILPQYRPYYYIVIYDETETALLNQVDVCRNGLDNAGLDSEMLEGEDVAVFFKYCYTRNFDERKVDEAEDYADYVKPEKVKFSLGSYTCDNVYAFTLAVRDYPLYVSNSWGAELFNIDNTKVVLTIKPVDKHKAIKRIDGAVVEVSAQRRVKLSEAQAQETHVQTMALLQQSIQNENEMLFDCTLTVTAFNNTEKPDATFRKDIRRKLMTSGFRISYMIGRQFDGFAAATVARRKRLRAYERGINSESLAAVFPFVFSSVIEPDGFTLGFEYYPVILDIWKRSADYINSNLVIFGKSGSGKSFFTKLLLLNVYSENSRIFILDPEDEYKTLAQNVKGAFIDVGSATQGRLNPLHIYPVLTDEGEIAAPDITFSAHLQFLDSFFRITLTGITADSLEELNNQVIAMYENFGITRETDCSEYTPDKFPTFDNLLATVEKALNDGEEMTMQRRQNLERIKTYIMKFATGGMFSTLWCGPSTLETSEKLTVFNFQSLFGTSNKVVANAQILVVMRYLDQQIINIREHNRSTGDIIHPFIVVDEGYNFIDPKYPIALDFIYLWFKRIRKYEGSIAFITQNLIDVLGNQEVVAKTTAIINNSQYSFIFSLAAKDIEILTDLYKNAGGINDTERMQIANAGNGDCFAICSSRQRTAFHVFAHDTVRALFDNPDALEELGPAISV
ncbi:MAG: DUF87 domain-containing protein [Clostridia bacterium]|nr:DUF87 domain-containing protein [Clostridia bacterium]